MGAMYTKVSGSGVATSNIGEVTNMEEQISDLLTYAQATYPYYAIFVVNDDTTLTISYYITGLNSGFDPDDVGYLSGNIDYCTAGDDSMGRNFWSAARYSTVWGTQGNYPVKDSAALPVEGNFLLVYDTISADLPNWATTWLEGYAPTAETWQRTKAMYTKKLGWSRTRRAVL